MSVCEQNTGLFPMPEKICLKKSQDEVIMTSFSFSSITRPCPHRCNALVWSGVYFFRYWTLKNAPLSSCHVRHDDVKLWRESSAYNFTIGSLYIVSLIKIWNCLIAKVPRTKFVYKNCVQSLGFGLRKYWKIHKNSKWWRHHDVTSYVPSFAQILPTHQVWWRSTNAFYVF